MKAGERNRLPLPKMKMKNGILVAALACTSLVVTSCYTPYPTYGGVAVGVGPGGVGVSASAEWTSASYDADGYPIYGYSYGRPVYGYTSAGVAIFTLAALTTAYYLPYWGCAHWCHHHDVYVHYCPSHCHKCWAPPRCPRGHQPHMRPPHDGPHPGKGVRVKEPSHRGVPDSGRPPMHGAQGPHNGGMNGRDMGHNGHSGNMPHNGGMNPQSRHNGGVNGRELGRNGNMNAPHNGNSRIQNLPGNIQTYSPQRDGGNNMQQHGMQGNSPQRVQNNAMQRGNSRAMRTQPAQRSNAMPQQRVQNSGMQRAVTPQGGAIRSYGPGASNRAALGGSRPYTPSRPSAPSSVNRASSPSFGGASRSMPSRGSMGSMGGGPRGGMGGGHFGGGRGGRR